MSESTGALWFSKEHYHASKLLICPCCSRRTLCGHGSITYRILTATCTHLPSRLRVLVLITFLLSVFTDCLAGERYHFCGGKGPNPRIRLHFTTDGRAWKSTV